MAPSFSDCDDEILIVEVAKHPSLWQLTHSSYKDQRVRDNIWAEIAKTVGQPLEQCKKRWRNVKDTYDRKQKRRVGSVSSMRKGKKWLLEGKLSFLGSAGDTVGALTSAVDEEVVDSSWRGSERVSLDQTTTTTETLQEHTSTTTTTTSQTLTREPTLLRSAYRTDVSGRKRRNHRENRRVERNKMSRQLLVEDGEDEIDLFFKSLAKSVKKLTPILQQRAKTETLQVVTRLETEMWEPMGNGILNAVDTSVDVSPVSIKLEASSYYD